MHGVSGALTQYAAFIWVDLKRRVLTLCVTKTFAYTGIHPCPPRFAEAGRPTDMARRLPPLNALKAFEAAARCGGFARAADDLHVSHAAISRHIQQLEGRLGVALFRRLKRGVQLTEAGARYAAALTDAFDRIAAATTDLSDGGIDDADRLMLSVEPSFAALWLVPRLGRFRVEHPGVDLVLDPTPLMVDFRSDPVDLAIRFGQGDWPNTRADHLLDAVNYPVCSPALLDGPNALTRPGDLAHHTLLHDEASDYWAAWLLAAGVTGVSVARGPIFRNSALAIDAAVEGHGVALGDNVLAARHLAAGRLRRPFALSVPVGAYYLVSPEGREDRPPAHAFRDWLTGEAAAFAAEDPAGDVQSDLGGHHA